MPSPQNIPTFADDLAAGHPSAWVIGVDEVGRGCLAGPVMAGAFVLPWASPEELPDWAHQIKDSKLLTPRVRAQLAPQLREATSHWAVGEASVEEIDRLNILQAVELAMKRAVESVLQTLSSQASEQRVHVLVDGNRVPLAFRGKATAIVGGDRRCLSIACASILAKVERDQLLDSLDHRYPGYGLAVHKGYGTPAHLRALQELRPTVIHRHSFAPVRLAAQG
ncbi:MAG: ribonuclease [Pseudomonadota bacterium]|jgi:ribonuclease HII